MRPPHYIRTTKLLLKRNPPHYMSITELPATLAGYSPYRTVPQSCQCVRLVRLCYKAASSEPRTQRNRFPCCMASKECRNRRCFVEVFYKYIYPPTHPTSNTPPASLHLHQYIYGCTPTSIHLDLSAYMYTLRTLYLDTQSCPIDARLHLCTCASMHVHLGYLRVVLTRDDGGVMMKTS